MGYTGFILLSVKINKVRVILLPLSRFSDFRRLSFLLQNYRFVRIGSFFCCFRVVIIKVKVLYRNYLVTYLRNDFKIGFYRESSRYFELKSFLTQKKG